MVPRPRRAIRAAVLLAAALLSACDELPSGPQVWTREAVGRRWVAVAEPAGLPSARSWVGWADPVAADSVRGLLAAAIRDRRSGHIELALAAEQAAAEVGAAHLARTPDAVTVLSAAAAVDRWLELAAEPASSGLYPELAHDRDAVAALRESARVSLAAGQTADACLTLTRAGGVARRWTPTAVAAAAVVQAELSIAADPTPSTDLLRARRLLRGARDGMASGDQARALQRALYALQLIEHDRGR
jgi:hypothetical protein